MKNLAKLVRRVSSRDVTNPPYEIWHYESGAEAHVVVASGELDLHAAPFMRQTLSSLLAGGRAHLIIDMSGVTFIDSAMIGVLAHHLHQTREADGSLAVVCRSENVIRTLEVAGIAGELQILDTLSGRAVEKVAALPRLHKHSRLVAAPRTRTLELTPHASELAVARGFAVAAARRAGLDPRQQYDLAVATSEAVANAIQHGAPGSTKPIKVWVEGGRDSLTIGVLNGGDFVLEPLPPGPLHEGGRGLRLMSHLVDAISVKCANAQTVVELSLHR
jgi:anti-sigma B factor antagonist